MKLTPDQREALSKAFKNSETVATGCTHDGELFDIIERALEVLEVVPKERESLLEEDLRATEAHVLELVQELLEVKGPPRTAVRYK